MPACIVTCALVAQCSCTPITVAAPDCRSHFLASVSAQIILLSVQERKAAEKVKRDGMAHEMARYDKGSMFLNLITSKKSKTEPEPEPEPLGQPLQVNCTLCAARGCSCKTNGGSAKHWRPEIVAHHQGSICSLGIQVARATHVRVVWSRDAASYAPVHEDLRSLLYNYRLCTAPARECQAAWKDRCITRMPDTAGARVPGGTHGQLAEAPEQAVATREKSVTLASAGGHVCHPSHGAG